LADLTPVFMNNNVGFDSYCFQDLSPNFYNVFQVPAKGLMRCYNNYIRKYGRFTPAKTITVSHVETMIERIIKGE